MRRTRWRTRLGLLVASTLVALLIAEGALRLFGYRAQYVNGVSSFHEHDRDLGLRGKPDSSARFRQPDFDVTVELDSNGFRKPGRPARSTGADRPTLYVLGDSFTWGWGVDQGESFPDLLARSLTEHEVRNFGLSGTGTVVQYLLFERQVRPSLRPSDLVLLAFYENDLPDNLGERMEEWAHARVVDGQVEVVPPSPPRLAVRVKNLLKDNSRLCNLIAFAHDRRRIRARQAEAERQTLARLAKRVGSGEDPQAVQLDYPADSAEVVVLRHYLTLFQRDVEAAGASFAVVCIPGRTVYGEGQNDAPMEPIESARHRAALNTARSLGIEVLDLLPTIRETLGREGASRLTYHHDPHWNPLGHQLAAARIERFLRDEILTIE